jgi:hypothetical protein
MKGAKIYLGIDPGASGGLASITLPRDDPFPLLPAVHTYKMPETERDLWKLVCGWGTCGRAPGELLEVAACIEKVGGYIGGPGFKAGSSAMFNFGVGYGRLRMALIAAEIPFEEIPPQRWQKAFGLHRKPNEKKTSFKNRLKSKAQQLFPGVEVTLATADALLLAEYTRRQDALLPLPPRNLPPDRKTPSKGA